MTGVQTCALPISKNSKKAQITTFVIIGVVLVIIAGFIFYLIGEEAKVPGVEEVPVEARPLKIFVEECLSSTAIDGIKLAGVQGGYIDAPESALETDYSTIAYYYYEDENKIPTKAVIESQISSFVNRALDVCLANFSYFKEQGFDVSTGEISTETTIRDNDVFVKIRYPITLIQEDKKTELDRYFTTVPIRLGHVYDISKLITSKTIADPEWIDMTFLSEFDVKIDIIPHDEESFVYSITDEKSSVKGEPFIFLFANKFVVNQPPMLDIPDTLTFADGQAVIFQVQASDPEDDPLTFSDDTAMFDITEQGVILFTPEVPGEFDVTITVTDDHRNEVSKVVRFVIE